MSKIRKGDQVVVTTGREKGKRGAVLRVLETGSVVHSDASIHRGMHAARPASEDEQVTLIGSEV